MELVLLNLGLSLLLWFLLWQPLAAGLALAIGAIVEQLVVVLGLSVVGIAALAWLIRLIVVLARRVQ